MNMNTGSPNFSRLLSMLALKRYEQPPPGYFHGFSGQVISRIRAGERAADPNVLQLLLIEWPWLQRLWIGLESKPALTGLLGAAACVLLLVGLLYPGRQELSPDQFSSASAGIMFSSAAERGHVNSPIAIGTTPELFETNFLGGSSPGSLGGQPVKFTLGN
jgi:hypothetical protein